MVMVPCSPALGSMATISSFGVPPTFIAKASESSVSEASSGITLPLSAEFNQVTYLETSPESCVPPSPEADGIMVVGTAATATPFTAPSPSKASVVKAVPSAVGATVMGVSIPSMVTSKARAPSFCTVTIFTCLVSLSATFTPDFAHAFPLETRISPALLGMMEILSSAVGSAGSSEGNVKVMSASRSTVMPCATFTFSLSV